MWRMIRKIMLTVCGLSFFCLSVLAALLWTEYRKGALTPGNMIEWAIPCAETADGMPDIPSDSADSAASGAESDGGTPSRTGSPAPMVVLDPGHGGEDGGAESPDGIPESGINLAVSQKAREILRLMGQDAILTREDDISLGDPTLPTVRQRKNADLRRRVEIVNGTDHAVMISVHQNILPTSPVTHGAQVFWNEQPGGRDLAELIQDALNRSVNTGNAKQAKPMGNSVYIMRRSEAPAALVECGFLSNAFELLQLRQEGYQTKLAAAIAAGYLRYAAGERAGP